MKCICRKLLGKFSLVFLVIMCFVGDLNALGYQTKGRSQQQHNYRETRFSHAAPQTHGVNFNKRNDYEMEHFKKMVQSANRIIRIQYKVSM